MVSRAGCGFLLATVLAVVCAGSVTAVPPPPPNPSESDIAAASAQVDGVLGQVGALINQVASANEELQRLDDEVATRREDVNKALVDLQDARDAAATATAAVGTAQQGVTDASTQIDQAQQRFDKSAARTYTQGSDAASIASYFGAENPDEVLDRAQMLALTSKSQQAVLDGLQRARAEQANKASAARQAKQDADTAAAQAQTQKDAAEQAIAAAQSALAQQNSRKSELQRSRDAAQVQLDAARADVSGLQGQRDAYTTWDGQRREEAAAISALADTAKQIAITAAARVAADQAQRDRAAELAAGQRPHTTLDEDDDDAPAPPPRKRSLPKLPSVIGPAAVEIVVDRGMSQLGVPYAWGGGDENGPTKGIRDGGVADAHGDYNKVGFDCSGLMIYAFAGIGISLPHYSGYQYTAGEQVPADDMRRGDMLFWGSNGSQHVALYLGDGTMLEAPQSGDVVKVSPVREDGMMPYVARLVP
ncbi:NlpC/P60 family protein [Aldersonia sp. NBC_00410]|uniref:NlpC/P60 family protein n=1 Tax=Aldersonia sp. NBC_00410 TaxID=2975954 RepID=UPI002258E570|nr:NlpC/P60 family protein [Aldersonia sp. NBC_00410]MCX5046649.1 NlpC/P60 family protein [Aldersonia sp. NBC_00410]